MTACLLCWATWGAMLTAHPWLAGSGMADDAASCHGARVGLVGGRVQAKFCPTQLHVRPPSPAPGLRRLQGKRYALQNTRIMVHHPSGAARGQV